MLMAAFSVQPDISRILNEMHKVHVILFTLVAVHQSSGCTFCMPNMPEGFAVKGSKGCVGGKEYKSFTIGDDNTSRPILNFNSIGLRLGHDIAPLV